MNRSLTRKLIFIGLNVFVFGLLTYNIQHINKINNLDKGNRQFDSVYKQNFSNINNSLDLSKATIELENKNLQYANFAYANFSGSVLRKTNFTGANLDHANFTNSILDGTIFNDEIFMGAIKNYANLKYANFNGAKLSNLDLRGIDLYGCTFKNAILTNITVDKTTNFDSVTVDGVSFKSVSGLTQEQSNYLSFYGATDLFPKPKPMIIGK